MLKREIQKIDTDHNFEPSMKILSRILKVILEKNSIGKTSLSEESNVNYVKLQRYLQWLEEKRLVEIVIKGGRVHIILSHKGREFTTMLSLL
jgi:predicted transcriptional regulator